MEITEIIDNIAMEHYLNIKGVTGGTKFCKLELHISQKYI